MKISPYDHNISIVAYKKNNVIYSGTYAWFMQIGYEEVFGLLGSQSDTGNNLKIDDIVGISICSKNQLNDAIYIGEYHSSEVNKLVNVNYTLHENNAITLNDSKCVMICKVIDIVKLKNIEEDNGVYFKVLKYDMNDKLEYLYVSDIKGE